MLASLYTGVLSVAALFGALSAGYILAQSPRQRATQLAALLAAGAAWWALCEARWNAAPDAATALHWMRLSTPGWAFIGGILPHLVGRIFDAYPPDEMGRPRAWLRRAARLGYAAGGAVLALATLGVGVHGAPVRVPWGWGYAPGPAQLAFFAAIAAPAALGVAVALGAFASPLSMAPPVHRRLVHAGLGIPAVLIVGTDIALPALEVPFPRLGSLSYALFALVVLGVGLRFGLSFFTPRHFSEEILDTLHEGVAMVTPSGLVRRVNQSFARLAGRSGESLVGVEIERLLASEPQEELRSGEDEPAELTRADGERIPVSLSTAPLRDARGHAMGLVVVVRDLREIQELRRRMTTQARLAAVGELAAGVAHEINNPLAFVRSNLALLERHWKTLREPESLPPEERAELLDEGSELIAESLSGVDRAAEIVRGVRRFTHAGHPEREPADLNELLEDTLAMVRTQQRASGVSLELRAGPLPPVWCAPQELRQVFLNLVVNAADAVRAGGRVVVTTSSLGEVATVEVSDDGAGIPPETVERIFDPFFTTKRVGEGTGLGLAIAWKIVTAHGGHIEVESLPGVGSTFRVHVPIRPERREEASPESAAAVGAAAGAARPVVQASYMKNVLAALERQGVEGEAVRLADPELFAEIGQALRLSWLPISWNVRLVEAAERALGRARALDFLTRCVHGQLDAPLFRNFVAGVVRLFGLDPGSLVRWLPKAIGVVFRNCGSWRAQRTAPDGAVLEVDQLPPELASNRAWIESMAAAGHALFALCRVAGRVELAAHDPERGHARFALTWSAPATRPGSAPLR